MSRGIRFKLYDQEERLALAFQHHCHRNLGINDDLNMLVKKVFLKFLRDSVDRSASDPKDLAEVSDVVPTEVVNGSSVEAIAEGDSRAVAVAPDGVASTATLDTQTVSSETSPA